MSVSIENKVWLGDCLELMKNIPDSSIDMILCDLPYGITSRNKWDGIICLKKLWEEYKRIRKPATSIVLTSVQPFTSKLILSNLDEFKYEWIWEKSRPSNFLNAKKQPLRKHESILVFSEKQGLYNPQGLIYNPKINKRSTTGTNLNESGKSNYSEYSNYPTSVMKFLSESKTIHPTQKPVDLFEYLIKTYTNEGDLVLDNCAGSGTTAIACLNSNRKYIMIESEKEYYDKILERISNHASLHEKSSPSTW